MKELHDILREFEAHHDQAFALATLVRAEGSTYRRVGARLLITGTGRTVGSLSGGCLEQEVALRARAVMHGGEPLLLEFDTRQFYGCHGKIEIFIERAPDLFLTDLAERLAARRGCLAVTNYADQAEPTGSRILSPADFAAPGTFVQAIHPAIRLLIFGAGPDTAPLRYLSAGLGWQSIEVVDGAAFSFVPDDWTVAIVKSHHYGRDFAALQKLLPLRLRYVGLVGSRRRRDQLLINLLQIGITSNAGFFSPAGLDLAAETPEEIALAIIAEIQREIGRASGQSLRDKKSPIHALPRPIECLLPVQ